jgi:aspartyl-tRNA(Asn)/glutamyl-tRNA(Gln) amidotransferase subunit A
MNLQNDATLTISQLAPLLRRRKLSPVELTRWILTRIERLQPHLNAYITITSDLALRQARQAEKEIAKGQYRGPLHGIPISLKDLFHTRGVRTTGGSRILRRFVPSDDAPAAARMSAAGAVLLGKTNLHEFAYGATNVNLHYGAVRNPWDLDRMSGGSSGGSAASVSAALALASLGTDTGGSIRIPAAACGCVGLKPTHGLVPLSGVIPLAPSLDHVGPLCRCVEDAALILSSIAGADPNDPSSLAAPAASFTRELRAGIKGLRIGIPKQYFFDRIQSGVRTLVLAAISMLEKLGARIHEVNLELMQETAVLAGVITVAEALPYHWRWLRTRAGDYDPAIRARMEASKDLPAVEYLLAQERRRSYSAKFERVMRSVDLLAAPTLPIFAPRIGDAEVAAGRSREDVRMALLRLTRPANLTGLPSISVPCGFSTGGLPAGLQLIGRRWDEATLLRAAYAYEQATPWHQQFPQVAVS